MISAITAANAVPTLNRLSRLSAGARSEVASKAASAVLSLGDPRKAAQTMRKEMASRRLQSVTERMRSLSLMIKADPRAALKLAAELARELKAAVKAYQDAGGRNVSSGDMAMIRRQAADAREAQSASAQPDEAGGAPPVETETANATAEARRAQQAYSAASTAENRRTSVERLTEMETTAGADQGFFEQARNLVAGLRKARDEIRAASHSALRPPSDDDWKDADRAQAELERQIDTAPGGISVRA